MSTREGGLYILKRIAQLLIRINQNTSIVRKIIVLTLCLIFFSLILVSSTYYINIRSLIENEVKSTYEMITRQYANSVSYKLNIYENLTSSITTLNSIQKALSMKNIDYYTNLQNDEEISSSIDFLSAGYRNSQIDAIQVFAFNPAIDFQGKYTDSVDHLREASWFEQTDMSSRKLQFLSSPDQLGVLSFVKVILSLQQDNRLELIGVVKIDVIKQSLFQLTDSRIGNMSDLMVYTLNENGKIMYKNSSQDFKSTGLSLSDLPGSERVVEVKIGRNPAIAVIQDIAYRGWKAVVIFPINDVSEKIGKAIVLIIISMIFIGAVSIVIILLFSKSLGRRLKLLLVKMEKVKKGNLTIDYVMNAEDEIGIVDRNFNEMVEKLKQTINENYLQKLGKREAELKALQFQINPHFLYNTLECVNSLAIVNNNTEISTIVLKLGEILRYNLGNNHSEYVELREEIKQIHNYIDIFKIRFGDRFNVIFDIPGELENCKILRFILQPIIENFVVHGFSSKRQAGCAEILATEKDGMLEITIQDDGAGIPENKLKEINKMLKISEEWQLDGKEKSIGLQNVNSRIKLAYGEEYGLEIESLYEVGTIVRITIPLKI